MTDRARWQEVDRLFAAALERPPGERAAFLDQACAGDRELRREVEELLAADADSTDFLEEPAGGWLGEAHETEEHGRLGPYQILEKIGAGGMGTVYLAERVDEHYRQRVAVKVLRSGLADTEALHRFLVERQILARLQHPNIARLYDGGSTQDGRPFLVMELVDGLPVDEYCDRNRLTVEERLVLFRKICGAVQAAHQNLLVHRDLKPGNILVGADGEPKLLDFGIAKQLASEAAGTEEHLTRTGLRVMTPSYASPEQVRGEAITTASDVYSLGVLLYELLAGRGPYRVAAGLPHEVERAICEQEAERPSAALVRPPATSGDPGAEEIAAARNSRSRALQRRLQGDLDNIVLLAMRKEPQRRYGSARQLAADLERHLKDLPVIARPDTLRYRGRKLLRRHRGAAVAAAAMVLIALGFVISLIVQGRRLALERDKARESLAFLLDTFSAADPFTGGGRLTAEEVLTRGADRVSQELAGQPDVQADLMDAIGQVELGLGQVDRAAPLLERSLEIRRRIFGEQSPEFANSLEHAAKLRASRGDAAGAEALMKRVLEVKRRRFGPRSLEVAESLNELAGLVTTAAPSPEVERLLQESLTIARRVEGPEGRLVADDLVQLGQNAQRNGQLRRAVILFRLGMASHARSLGEEHPVLLTEEVSFSGVLIAQGQLDEAEALLRRLVARSRTVLGPTHPRSIEALNNLAVVCQSKGEAAEAEQIYREVLAVWRRQFGPGQKVAAALGNLGGALVLQGKNREAVPVIEESLAIRRRILGERHPEAAQALLVLAQAKSGLGQDAEALDLAEQALAIVRERTGPDHPLLTSPLRVIGRILMKQGKPAAAEPYLRKSVEIRRKFLPPGHPELVKDETALATCLAALATRPAAAPPGAGAGSSRAPS